MSIGIDKTKQRSVFDHERCQHYFRVRVATVHGGRTIVLLPPQVEHAARTRKVQSLGAAIYKWEGKIAKGPFLGKLGILIGETDDIRSRINQYATGTQPGGNKYWRTEFLECSEAYLYVLACSRFQLADGTVLPISEMLSFKNGRLVLEQLLVLKERHAASEDKWIVNKWE